jgi:hypothetical protein
MGIAGGTPDIGALCRNCKHGFESMESFEHSFGANAEKLWPIFQIYECSATSSN